MQADSEERVMPNDLAAVRLVCLFCAERRTIHVPRDRRLPERILWECLECQKKNCAPTGPIESSSSTKPDTPLY